MSAEPRFAIKVASDKLSVSLRTPQREADRITKQQILDVLAENSIHLTPADEERVGRYVRALRKGSAVGRELVVVKGEPPVHGRDGRIIDLVAAAAMKVDEQGNVNHYGQNILGIVVRGQTVLRIEPPTQAKPGRDVFGEAIPADEGVWPQLELNDHLRRSPDGLTVTSLVPGSFRYAHNRAEVEPDLTVNSDVSFHSGNIDFEKDIVVDKDVFTRFEVTTPQSVIINGAVEGATIEAGRDVLVRHGILGKRKGSVVAGGDITCQFASGARLSAGGNVEIAKYCYDSTIRCQLLKVCGILAGGEISCTGGSSVAILGSKGHRQTMVRVRAQRGRAGEMTRLHGGVAGAEQELAELREAYKPYRGRFMSLRGQARQRAEEIRARIQELEQSIGHKESGLARITTASGACKGATLEIRERAFAGVAIEFDNVRTVLREHLVGPHRLELRRGSDGLQIVAVNLQTNAAHPLPAAPKDAAA